MADYIHLSISRLAPGSTGSPGGGYPQNPADPALENPEIEAGIPPSSDGVSNGFQIMAGCGQCGMAVPVGPEFGAHVQAHNEAAHQMFDGAAGPGAFRNER